MAADFRLGPPIFAAALAARRLPAIFDTAAGLSVLNARLVDELQPALAAAEPLEVGDPSGAKFQGPAFACHGLAIGPAGFPVGRVLALDLSPLEQEAQSPVELVFGPSWMTGRAWRLDRQAQRLTFLA